VLAARTNYFRETYAYDDEAVEGILAFKKHPGLLEAARKVHECAIVVPTLARYRRDEVRFSVSWKAYCYRDEAEQRIADAHRDDLSLERILDTLTRDLRARGKAVPADETALARALIDTYIRFPAPARTEREGPPDPSRRARWPRPRERRREAS